MATEVNLVLGADTTQVDKGATSLDQLSGAAKKTASELAALAKIEEQVWEAGTKLVLKLEDLVATFGMTTEQVYSFRAAQLGVTEAAAPLIAQLEAMKAATKAYGVVITEVGQIEEARINFEESALTAFNAFKIRTLAENQAAEESAAAVFAAFKNRTMAENRAAAIASIDAEVEANAAALRKQESDLTVFSAFKIRTMEENRVKAAEILQQQEVEAAALAEKQALAEIAWATLSTKARIEQLEKLKTYQANPAISNTTTEKTFGSAAINDLPNLTRYQQEYTAALNATATAHGGVKNAAVGASEALGGVQVQTARATNESIVLAREFGRGNYTRMAGSFSILAQALGATVNPITIAIGAIGALGFAVVKGQLENKAFSDSLIMTGNYAGMTADSMNSLAHTLGTSTGTIGYAKDAILALASSGKFTAGEIGTITTAAIELEHAAGTPIEATVKRYEQLADAAQKSSRTSLDLTKTFVQQNETTHELNTTQVEEIMTLERTGQSMKALQVLTDDLANVTKTRSAEMLQNVGYIEGAWNAVTKAIKNAWAATLDIGKPTGPAQKLAEAQANLSAAQYMENNSQNANLPSWMRSKNSSVDDAKQQVYAAQEVMNLAKKQAEIDSTNTQNQAAGTKALLALQEIDIRHKKDSIGLLQQALDKNKEFEANLKKTDPNSPLLYPEAMAARKAATEKEFTPKEAKGHADQYAKASLNDILAPAQQDISAQASALADTQRILDAQYKQGDISLQSYLDKEHQARATALANTIADYEKMIAATKKYINDVSADPVKALQGRTQLNVEQAKLATLQEQSKNKSYIGDEKDQEKVQAYTDGILKLTIALDKLQGKLGEASLAEEQLKNRQERKTLTTNAQGPGPLADQAKVGLDALDQIQALTVAKAKIAGDTEKYNALIQTETTLEGRLALNQQKGSTDQLTALRDISNARIDEVAKLQQVAADMQAVADASGDPKLIANAKAFQLQIDQMTESADQLGIKFNSIVDGPFDTFFTNIMNGSKGAKAAFLDLAKGIEKGIDDMVSKELTSALFGSGAGGAGGVGGWLSGLMGVNNGGAGGSGSGGLFGALAGWLGGGSSAAGGVGITSGAAGSSLTELGLVGGYADGGDPPVNAPSLVGERGPELFVPKTAGTIITNQNLNNALNGKSTAPTGDTYLTQHVNFTVQGNTTRQTQSQMAAAVFSSGSKLAQRNN